MASKGSKRDPQRLSILENSREHLVGWYSTPSRIAHPDPGSSGEGREVPAHKLIKVTVRADAFGTRSWSDASEMADVMKARSSFR